MSKKEAQARLKINRLLEQSGWRILDDGSKHANVDVETKTDLGDDFEHTKTGFIDYLLLDDNQKPIAVLEAKRESIAPLSAKEQARKYANSKHIRFVILSNGNTHYFWDIETGNPEPIMSFPTPKSLTEYSEYRPDVEALAKETVTDGYLASAQMQSFDQHPDYLAGGETRQAYILRNKLKLLRAYQVDAISAIQHSAKSGNTRFLLEMATGTGKTLTCAALIRLFLNTGNARRVLFLVDRLELEDQAKKAFKSVFGETRNVQIYKDDKTSWNTADILITTVQSFQTNDRYRDFSPTDFDLVISDEAHRSISGNARAVFEYFHGWKIGLTATPKDYLKNTSENENSTREFEKRQLLDTYRTFGCESGEPTYRYDLCRGVEDGFLVNPTIIDARTDITTQLLSDNGYAVHKVISDEDGNEENADTVYGARDYEKHLYNEKTNIAMCEAFLDLGQADPITGEFGKSIIFAVSQKHAAKLVQILNQLAMEKWPGKYNSDFAVQITSQVADAQNMTVRFSENDLLGHTKWLEHYNSSRARIAVTVAMMTTGYDCSDLINLGFMRPVFSPSDFIQMKGRGTRLHTFIAKYDENGGELPEPVEIKKTGFNLIDFFAVCEYFEEEYDYTTPLTVPKDKEQKAVAFGPGAPASSVYRPIDPVYGISEVHDLGEDDRLATTNIINLTSAGMKIDQQMFKKFREETQNDATLAKLYKEDKEAAEEYLKKEIFDKPIHFMNLEKLRRFFNLDRRVNLREALDILLKNITPKTKAQFIDEKFEEMAATKQLSDEFEADPTLYNVAKDLFDSYISDAKVQEMIDSKQFGRLDETIFATADYRRLKNANLAELIVQYICDYIDITKLRGGK